MPQNDEQPTSQPAIDPQVAPTPPDQSDAIEARISKARQDERAKAQAKIDDERKKQVESNAKRDEAIKELTELRAQLAAEQDAKLTEEQRRFKLEQSRDAEIASLKVEVKKTKALIEVVAEQATIDVRTAELKAYRERKLTASGVEFQHLVPVTLDSEEIIDAAVAQQQEIEATMRSRAEEKVKAEMGKSAPTTPPTKLPNKPLNPSSGAPSRTTGDPLASRLSVKDLGGMKRDDYEKRKAARLERARATLGD